MRLKFLLSLGDSSDNCMRLICVYMAINERNEKHKVIVAKLPTNVRLLFADIHYCKQKLSKKKELSFSVMRKRLLLGPRDAHTIGELSWWRWRLSRRLEGVG